MADKKPVPVDLPEEEPKKLAGKTVKKGEDEYVIVVQGGGLWPVWQVQLLHP